MRLSRPVVLVAAALETLALRWWNGSSDGKVKLSSLALSFGLFVIGNFVVCVLYFTFIYPFYVSPTRNLPTAADRHWLLGHMLQLWSAPGGRCSRTW